MKRLIILAIWFQWTAVYCAPMPTNYTMGSAPFCAVDNAGNESCFYYTLEACEQAPGNHLCVHK